MSLDDEAAVSTTECLIEGLFMGSKVYLLSSISISFSNFIPVAIGGDILFVFYSDSLIGVTATWVVGLTRKIYFYSCTSFFSMMSVTNYIARIVNFKNCYA